MLVPSNTLKYLDVGSKSCTVLRPGLHSELVPIPKMSEHDTVYCNHDLQTAGDGFDTVNSPLV